MSHKIPIEDIVEVSSEGLCGKVVGKNETYAWRFSTEEHVMKYNKNFLHRLQKTNQEGKYFINFAGYYLINAYEVAKVTSRTITDKRKYYVAEVHLKDKSIVKQTYPNTNELKQAIEDFNKQLNQALGNIEYDNIEDKAVEVEGGVI
jgi:hypothetical protein